VALATGSEAWFAFRPAAGAWRQCRREAGSAGWTAGGWEADDDDRGAAAHVSEAARLWQDKYPDLPVELITLGGPATHALVDASLGCSLLVVGRHSAHAFGRMPGSVGQTVIRHVTARSPWWADRRRTGVVRPARAASAASTALGRQVSGVV
jgi:hypothetical protein